MDELRQDVQEFQERWNSMVLDITEDLKITCEEAQTVSKWLVTERKAYAVLKKKINLEIRTIRNEIEQRINEDEKRGSVRELRLEQARRIHPLKELLLYVDELLLKSDEMKLRVERLLARCQERESS